MSAHKHIAKIRISRGSLGGRTIRFAALPDLRPTASRVREAVFSMIFDLAQTHGFIDVCAGSGIMGFEAYSCGFSPVIFLDTKADVIQTLETNGTELDVDALFFRASALHLDRLGLVPRTYVLYADPPYREKAFHAKMLAQMARWREFEEGSVYVAEGEEEGPWTQPGFSLLKRKKFGRTHITILRKEKPAQSRGKMREAR